MEYYKKLFKSFEYAFKGVYNTIKTERNMRIHITCLIYMFSILGFTDWFTLDRADWAILTVASGTVIACEVINTAIENAVNLATQEYNKFAEAAKDAAAGAVLADVWVDGVSMPVIDCLGDEFLNYVKDGMKITVKADGVVEVE